MLAQVSKGDLKLGGIFDNLKVDLNKYNEIIDGFKNIDLSLPKYKDFNTGKSNRDTIAETIEGCDDVALSYFKTLDDGNGIIDNQAASTEGLGTYFEKSGQAFDFAAIKASLLNSALNAGIFLAVSLTIQSISTGINNYIHRVENARERTAELLDEFQQKNLP